MIRFVDMRAADIAGSRFAFWNTTTDSFVPLCSYAWGSWAEFESEFEEVGSRLGQPLERFKGLCPPWVFAPGPGGVAWSYNKQPVPGHDGWWFQIGLGGPCWLVVLDVDSYTGAHIDSRGVVDARHTPAEVLRWLLDNHPPLDSWVRPTEEEVKRSWDTPFSEAKGEA